MTYLKAQISKLLQKNYFSAGRELMVKDSKDSTFVFADVGALPALDKKTHSQFVYCIILNL